MPNLASALVLTFIWAVPFGAARQAANPQKLSWEEILVVSKVDDQNLISRAVLKGDSKELVRLIEMLPNEHKFTAVKVGMRTAIDKDNSEILKLLTQQNASKPILFSGLTPLSYAALYGKLKSLSFLAQTTDNTIRDSTGRIALHYAVVGGPGAIRKLAKSKNLVNSRDKLGATPLHYACKRRLDSVQLLLRLGANPDIRDVYGKTPRDKLEAGDPDYELIRKALPNGKD